MTTKTRRNRIKFTAEVIAYVLERLRNGEYQHDIAADLGCNQGRISEINTGKRAADHSASLGR